MTIARNCCERRQGIIQIAKVQLGLIAHEGMEVAAVSHGIDF